MISNSELEQYYLIDEKIKNIEEDYKKAFDNATRISASLNGMPNGKGNVGDKVGEFSSQMADISRIKLDMILAYTNKKNIIEDKISRLNNKYSIILHRRYIEKKQLKDIAIELDVSYDTIKDWHRRAIYEYTNLKNPHEPPSTHF